MIKIAVSLGELVDKVTILTIKQTRIDNPAKLANIEHELELLTTAMTTAGITSDNHRFQALQAVNGELWDIEDRIRRKEACQEFDEEFIQLARSVYVTNDRRSAIKRDINVAHGSDLMEEKEYVDYKGPAFSADHG